MIVPDTYMGANPPDDGYISAATTGDFIRKKDSEGNAIAGESGLPSVEFSAMAVDPTGSTTAPTKILRLNFR